MNEAEQTAARNALCVLMSNWSEEYYRAGWHMDLPKLLDRELERTGADYTHPELGPIAWLHDLVGYWPDDTEGRAG